jgi:hypothetical protein
MLRKLQSPRRGESWRSRYADTSCYRRSGIDALIDQKSTDGPLFSYGFAFKAMQIGRRKYLPQAVTAAPI